MTKNKKLTGVVWIWNNWNTTGVSVYWYNHYGNLSGRIYGSTKSEYMHALVWASPLIDKT